MSDPTTIVSRVLVVDDEEAMAVFVKRTLRKAGHEVLAVHSAEAAQTELERRSFDLVITDLRMPGLDGMELLAWIRDRFPSTRVVVMTGYGTIPSAIAALKAGAEDYVTKPFDSAEIVKTVDRVLATGRLRNENRLLRKLIEDGRRFEGLVGSSPPMRLLYRRIEEVATRDGAVLIEGESGTGKELVARAIHRRSTRAARPMIAVNCAALPQTLIAAELFGVEEGAFTGASKDRLGAVRRADGGTFFLDEIGDLPMAVQPALLRLVECGDVTPVGGSETVRADVRIVAASNRDLKQMVVAGTFRSDLFYRLNVFPLQVPALRDRRDDIPDLVRTFVHGLGRDDGAVSLEAMALLEAHDWPGNVRELENAVARMVALADGGSLTADLLPAECHGAARPRTDVLMPFKVASRQFEREYLIKLLEASLGNISEAARRAKVSRPTLHARIAHHGIDVGRFK